MAWLLITAMLNLLLAAPQAGALPATSEHCRHSSAMEHPLVMNDAAFHSHDASMPSMKAVKTNCCTTDLCNNHCPQCVHAGCTIPSETTSIIPPAGKNYSTGYTPRWVDAGPSLIPHPPK